MVFLDNIIIIFFACIVLVHYGSSGSSRELKDACLTKEQHIFRKRRTILWIVLLAIASIQMRRVNRNHYEVLNVSIDCAAHDIQAQYRRRMIMFKNGDETTFSRDDLKEQQELLYQAYTTLVNATSRKTYNRFGPFAKNREVMTDVSLIATTLFSSVVFYFMCVCIGYIGTIPLKFKEARQMFSILCLGLFCFEVQLRVLGIPFKANIPYWNTLLIFEQIELLKRLMPIFLSISMMFSMAIFKDDSQILRQLLRGVLVTNRFLCKEIQIITTQLTDAKQHIVEDVSPGEALHSSDAMQSRNFVHSASAGSSA